MTETQHLAVLTSLVDRLQAEGSWCGETHVQKTAYFLEELLHVPFEYDFILYKHGPFSFELREELSGMRSDGLLDVEPRPYPYGPSLVATDLAQSLVERFPKTLARYEPKIDFVVEQLGAKGVVELEQLSTALLVTQETDSGSSVDERAGELVSLKPHVSLEEARWAVESVDAIAEEASKRFGVSSAD